MPVHFYTTFFPASLGQLLQGLITQGDAYGFEFFFRIRGKEREGFVELKLTRNAPTASVVANRPKTGVVGLDVSTHRFSCSIGQLPLCFCTISRQDISFVGLIGELDTWATDAS